MIPALTSSSSQYSPEGSLIHVLFIGVHPDDHEFPCGGTAALLTPLNGEFFVSILPTANEHLAAADKPNTNCYLASVPTKGAATGTTAAYNFDPHPRILTPETHPTSYQSRD